MGEASQLVLVYTESCTGDHAAAAASNLRDDGFALGFRAVVHPVEIDSGLVPRLVKLAKQIWSAESAPEPRDGCTDCQQVDRLMELMSILRQASALPSRMVYSFWP